MLIFPAYHKEIKTFGSHSCVGNTIRWTAVEVGIEQNTAVHVTVKKNNACVVC